MEEIFKNVCLIIETSIGTDKDTIKLENTLFNELGIDSIDLVDILYELETFYDVELKVSDIESKIKTELGDTPYEVDGLITKEGLDAIKIHMPEIDAKNVKEGLSVHNLVQLLSVHSLCNIIIYRLESIKND